MLCSREKWPCSRSVHQCRLVQSRRPKSTHQRRLSECPSDSCIHGIILTTSTQLEEGIEAGILLNVMRVASRTEGTWTNQRQLELFDRCRRTTALVVKKLPSRQTGCSPVADIAQLKSSSAYHAKTRVLLKSALLVRRATNGTERKKGGSKNKTARLEPPSPRVSAGLTNKPRFLHQIAFHSAHYVHVGISQKLAHSRRE